MKPILRGHPGDGVDGGVPLVVLPVVVVGVTMKGTRGIPRNVTELVVVPVREMRREFIKSHDTELQVLFRLTFRLRDWKRPMQIQSVLRRL